MRSGWGASPLLLSLPLLKPPVAVHGVATGSFESIHGIFMPPHFRPVRGSLELLG